MKKYLMVLAVVAVSFWTYSHADMSLTRKVLKPVIAYQCGEELKQSKLWKVSTYLMQDSNKAKLEHNVCNCVGEKALIDVPASTLLKAIVNEEAKKELTQKAITNSLKGCLKKFTE